MQIRIYSAGMPQNPLLRFVALIVVAVATVGAVLLGAALISLFVGLAVIAGLVLCARLWWVRRKLRKAAPRQGSPPREFLDVEYKVLEERSASDDRTDGS
jgi:uncharacterized iron-regulated membrane protein